MPRAMSMPGRSSRPRPGRSALCAAAVALAGCATAIKPVVATDIKYVPGQTSSAELVRQAGLPNVVQAVTIAGVPYKKFVYLKGPESMRAFIPIAIPTGSNSGVGGVLITNFQTGSGSALECLVSAGDVVVGCNGGSRE